MTVSKQALEKIINTFSNQKIYIWADLVVDHYIYGIPGRISREAPVLILSYDREWMVPGGGANTLNNLVSLGASPTPAGIIGDDPPGRFLLDTFEQLKIPSAGIVVDPDHPTLTKVRILAGPRSGAKQQIVRYDRSTCFQKGTPLLSPGEDDLLVVSDYGYSTVDPAEVERFRKQGVRVIVDSRFRLEAFAGVYAVTPNEEEATSLLGRQIATKEEAVAAAGEIRQKLEVEVVLLTRGSEGMVLSTDEGDHVIPVHGADQATDITGAGDTVLATFACALKSGASPLEAADLANIAGAVVVMKLGTATCSADELLRAVQSDAC